MAERKITNKDFAKVAEYISQEYTDRKKHRDDKEKDWREIDRQIAMTARVPVKRDGTKNNDWMPCLELPLQANAKEVLGADARRLALPQGNDWYESIAFLSDKEMRELERKTLVAGVEGGIGGKVDQDTANLIVHAVLDNFHSKYRYRGMWDRILGEGICYGTYVGRIGLQKVDIVSDDFRNVKTGKIPMIFPVSIKNVYLDDSSQHVLHEGTMIAPSYIRTYWRRLKDLKLESQIGNGWQNMSGLEEDKNGHIQLLEMEGDFVLDRTRGEDMYLPSMKITVAMQATSKIVRWIPMETPFRTYFSGVYQSEDAESPYGTSPLMKGMPIQENATFALNRSLAVAALQAEPPCTYNDGDNALKAAGGPDFSPGAMFPSDRPQDVREFKIGDLSAMFAMAQALLVQYEQTTQVNDPRRGGEVKSHTTALANDIQLSRGLLRTEDFIEDFEEGPLKDSLYKEYWFAKKALKDDPILLKARGTEGFISIKGSDLPEQVEFFANGSRGVLSKRERQQNMLTFTTLVANLTPLLQMEGSAPKATELLAAIAAELDIVDADRFTAKSSQGMPAADQIRSQLQAIAGGVPGQANT